MDKYTAKLVADLALHLCLELNLRYGDIQLVSEKRASVDAVERAFWALLKAKARTPEVLERVILRTTRGEQHLNTLADPRPAVL